MKTVLLVEDDPDMRIVLGFGLESGGFRVVSTHDGPSAINTFHSVWPDLVLVDLLLGPGSFDGFEVCKRIRKTSDVPVIFLSVRGEDEDQLVAFALGADDYILKPISQRVLVARVGLALSRTERTGVVCDQIVEGGLQIDTLARTVSLNGVAINLTRIEFDLLVILASQPNRVVTREWITSQVWRDWYGSDSHIDVHMSRLRKKIVDTGGPRVGVSVRGIGFRFV